MRNQETGLDYAKFDHSDTRIRQAQYRQQPDWRDEYLELLRVGNYDAAHDLRIRNDERYARDCEAKAAEVFPLAHAPLKSLREIQSEKDEAA